MPTKTGRDEQVLVRLFVSAYENFAWAGSRIDRLDEHFDGAVEALITRADGQTMAIEHTLIEPFVGDKQDHAAFARYDLYKIELDESLRVPNTSISVYVPVGLLDGQKLAKRKIIVESIHTWIKETRLELREGKHQYPCDLDGLPLPVKLTFRRQTFNYPRPGSLFVRRQQVTNDLDKGIERALLKKLPKLVKTKADRRVLFLERDQFTFDPDLIFAEIERQRPHFPLLEQVDEIWHVETISREEGDVYFEQRKGTEIGASFVFQGEVLM